MSPALSLLAIAIPAFLVAVLGTGLARRYALARSVIDVPGARSSHSVPTPRGGGLGIVAALVLCLPLVLWLAPLPATFLWGWGGGMVLVAAVGWFDDHRPLSPLLRGLAHALAAVWLVAWLGGMSELDLGLVQIELGFFGSVLAVLGCVWVVNLYNFMDGTDALAGSQGAAAAMGGALLLAAGGAQGLAGLAVALGGACLGFLVWNWPPARVFMGDVGSYAIGFSFVALALAGVQQGAVPVLAWVMLLGVFVFDATFTLFRRLLQGERWYEAHRSHAYQRLVQAGWSHRGVALGALCLTLGLCLPVSALAVARPQLLLPLLGLQMAAAFLLWRALQRRVPAASPRGA